MDDKKAEEIATKFPGHINFSGQINGHYSGALAVEFVNAQDMNNFFEANRHVIVTGVWPQGNGTILCIYTTQLESRDLRYLAEWDEKVNDYLARRREEDDAAEIAEEEAKRAEKAETERLAALGRKCELNHKKIKEKK